MRPRGEAHKASKTAKNAAERATRGEEIKPRTKKEPDLCECRSVRLQWPV
jgi:hypothetical protein